MIIMMMMMMPPLIMMIKGGFFLFLKKKKRKKKGKNFRVLFWRVGGSFERRLLFFLWLFFEEPSRVLFNCCTFSTFLVVIIRMGVRAVIALLLLEHVSCLLGVFILLFHFSTKER
jgi:hypothetical protein